jgi:hypothetical protein
MPGTASRNRPALAPLSPRERAEARAVAERLAVEVTRLLGAVEPQYRNAFALAKFLKVDRTSCQRLLSAVSTVDESTLVNAPGTKALAGLIDAMRRRGVDDAVLRGFEETIAGMQRVFADMGGHQRGFAQRVYLTQQVGTGGAPQTAAGSADQASHRLFEAACELTGRWSDTQTQIAIVRPSASHERACDVARARGLIGHVQHQSAVPLVFTHLFGTTEAEQLRYRELRPSPKATAPTFMLDEYCSSFWQVSSFVDRDTLIQTVTADERAVGLPGDLIMGSSSIGAASDPRFDTPPLQEVWAAVEYPARCMVLDVYLHRDLARSCTSGADAHTLRLNDPSSLRQTHRRWMTRIGDPLPLSLLGTGIEGADCRTYPRQRALTESLFSAAAWDPGEFFGFRLECRFPLWRTAYRAYFNFQTT